MLSPQTKQCIMFPILAPLLIVAIALSMLVEILAYPIGKIIDWTER